GAADVHGVVGFDALGAVLRMAGPGVDGRPLEEPVGQPAIQGGDRRIDVVGGVAGHRESGDHMSHSGASPSHGAHQRDEGSFAPPHRSQRRASTVSEYHQTTAMAAMPSQTRSWMPSVMTTYPGRGRP